MNYTTATYSNINPVVFYGGGFCGGVDPRREQYAGEDVAGVEVPNYKTKYEALQNVIKDNYQLFEVDYYGVDNDNYVDGAGFCCEPKAQAKNARSLPTENVDYEKLQYYYHSDHLGSASYITNLDGEVVQHVEYVPFGEVFLEERNNTWNTPFLFNGKELDEETGLYYYGARYYNPRISLWYGVDPLFEKYPAHSPYCYTMNNPISAIDPDGKVVVFVNGLAKRGTISIASLFSPKPKKAYWGESFLEGATFYFKDKNLQYTNGSGKTMFSTAKRRMRRGEKYAYKQIELATQGKESIFNGMVSKGEDGELNWTDETIKLVTHSHGAAFGEGMSRALQKSGANIEEVVNVAPHGKFEVSNLPNTTQVNVKGDPVSRKSGRGEALQGTDTNITKKSDAFLKGYDKVKYRHAIPIHTGKTFDIIKNETKQ